MGCNFAARCAYATDKCREEEPGFYEISEGHISTAYIETDGRSLELGVSTGVGGGAGPYYSADAYAGLNIGFN